MRVRDLFLFLFLIGSRQAIERIAASPGSLWIALLFVLSAGLARNYDTESLRHEPWHLFVPLLASTASAIALYLVVFGLAAIRKLDESHFTVHARSFITLFWMTAPMAWLYAIPYEQFLDGGNAVEMNLWTLAVVSVWRIVLMARVTAILLGMRTILMFPIIALYGNGVIFVLLKFAKLPVLDFMGGVQLSDEARVVQQTVISITMLSFITIPVLVLWSIVAFAIWKPKWLITLRSAEPTIQPHRPLIAMALASIAVWLPLLPLTQPPQYRRYAAESLLKSGQIDQGVKMMVSHARNEFPPVWEPPPRISYGDVDPDVLDVLESTFALPQGNWVRELYVAKLLQMVKSPFDPFRHVDPTRCLDFLRRDPYGAAIAKAVVTSLGRNVKYLDLEKSDEDAVRQIFELAQIPWPDVDAPTDQ